MDELVKEIVPLLQYLIPGFMTAWIFYSFTAFKRPDSFGQVVQALIFTFLIHCMVLLLETACLLVGKNMFVLGVWTEKSQAVSSAAVAIWLGFCSCFVANNDRLHGWLRGKKITKQSSFPSEWFSAFSTYPRFVVLHLNDERRLYGWPSEWPSHTSSGQFVLLQPSWLADDGTELPIEADVLVIDVSRVQWVEFTAKTWE